MYEENFKKGIFDISNTEYHNSLGISRSMLMRFKKSPYHYWYEYLSGLSRSEEATPAMNIGSAVHTLVLESYNWDDEFYTINQATRPRKETNPYIKMIEEARDRIILTRAEKELAYAISTSVLRNKEACMLLENCRIERSIYFTHEPTGLLCKVRPDAWCGSLICDLKTTSDASLRAFQSSSMSYGYFLQAAMCYRALESIDVLMEQFAFIVAEKAPPYTTAIYVLTDDALQYGLNQFDNLMSGLKRCIDTDNWPGYGIQDLNVPGYAKFDDTFGDKLMSNEIALQNQQENALAVWDDSNLKDIRDLFAPKLTELEFKGFVNMGKATELNPFLREIWAVKYDSSKPAQYFIGRDGYRKSAQQSMDYDYHRVEAVYSEDFYENDNGVIKHKYSFGKRGVLLGAYCLVKRKSSSKEMYTSVLLSEYDKKQSNWNSMKETMIKKVAEAQGLKAAFQERFSGTYSEHEQEIIMDSLRTQIISQKEKMNLLLAKKVPNYDKNESIQTIISDADYVCNASTSVTNSNVPTTDSIASIKTAVEESNAKVSVIPGNRKSNTTDETATNGSNSITEDQLEIIDFLLHEKALDKARQLKALDYFNVQSFAQLSEEQANEMIKILNKIDV